MKKGKIKIVCCFVFILHVSFFPFIRGQAHSYYLSSTGGNDTGNGSIESPWASLEKISAVNLQPGDTVFFKRGERFDGHFIVNGSGEEGTPVVITAYGEGEKPVITGEAGEENGGDYREAIYVENHDNITFEGIEVRNERLHTRTRVDSTDANGLYIYNSGDQILENFTFRNMTFRNVFAVKEMNDPADFNALEVAAVRIESARNTVAGKEKNIRNVFMDNCYFENLQRLGVLIKHGGGNAGVGNDSLNRNMNLVFRNNEFHNTGGTCILPTNTWNVLIEGNLFDHPGASTDPRMPGRGSAVWTWRCRNTVIQYNQCLHVRGYLDSHGIHIDHENKNTFIQYNYMEDCEGGFVEILGGNVNAVYRFNISVNDGWRENPNWYTSNHTIWINEKASGGQVIYSDSSFIYNNTIFIDSAYATAIYINATHTFIYNNIFYAVNGADIGGKQVLINNNGTPLYMTNNLYFGTIATNFTSQDENPYFGEPDFVNGGSSNPDGYLLNDSTPALNSGVANKGPEIPGAGKGIFESVPAYPVTDFFGNPVDLDSGTPNIGACNLKEWKTDSINNIREWMQKESFILYPNPARSRIYIQSNNFTGHVPVIRVYDMQGSEMPFNRPVERTDDRTCVIYFQENISPGYYFIRIDNRYGKPVYISGSD